MLFWNPFWIGNSYSKDALINMKGMKGYKMNFHEKEPQMTEEANEFDNEFAYSGSESDLHWE